MRAGGRAGDRHDGCWDVISQEEEEEEEEAVYFEKAEGGRRSAVGSCAVQAAVRFRAWG